MASFYGNSVANNVVQGRVTCYATSWTALQVGSTPQSNRFSVRMFVKGNPGQALMLAYANINVDGTFTTPTPDIKGTTIYPGGRTWIEPLSDKVAVYGRLDKKAGATQNSVQVVVTEFS